MKNKNFPKTSIIVLNYNGKKFLKDCFESISRLNYPKNKIELIIVDNNSSDDSVPYMKKNFPYVKIIKNDTNLGYVGNNAGIKHAKGGFIALLNNDTKVDKNWLTELIKVITSNDSIGAVGSKVLFMDGRIQSVGHQEYPNFYWGDKGFLEHDEGQYQKIQEVPSICGCSVLYRKKCLNDVGLFDEDFFIYLEDVELSIKCRKKGWKLLYVPRSIVYHKYNGTNNLAFETKLVERNRLLLLAKHFPYRLPESLHGKGYYSRSDEDILDILPLVFKKLIEHNDLQTVYKILPNLFKNLKKINNFKIDCLLKELKNKEKGLKNKEKELKHKEKIKEKELKNKKEEFEKILEEKQKEVDRLYNSLGYKLILSNIWTVHNLFKKKRNVKE